MIYLNDVPLLTNRFPNGELVLWKDDIVKNEDGKNKIILKYESDADLFDLLLVRKAVWFPVDLHITYFPYSRMDRTSKELVFTLKSIAKFINWLDFASVHIYEPHSDVTPALLNHCKIHSVTPELLKKTPFDIKKDIVYYPDSGAFKHYAEIIQTNRCMVGMKQRDFKTGKIKRLDVAYLVGRFDAPVYIVDDLCSKGGTFVMAAEELKHRGFTDINLVVAHCENTIFSGKIFSSGLIKNVYTTDSILRFTPNNPEAKLHVFSLTDFM